MPRKAGRMTNAGPQDGAVRDKATWREGTRVRRRVPRLLVTESDRSGRLKDKGTGNDIMEVIKPNTTACLLSFCFWSLQSV